jgi:beta-galactosidase
MTGSTPYRSKRLLNHLLGLLLSLLAAPPAMAEDSPRQVLPFDASWYFTKDDPADVAGKLDDAQGNAAIEKTGQVFSEVEKSPSPLPAVVASDLGKDVAYVQPQFDDSSWRLLDLPHDWAIEEPFDLKYAAATAKLPYWGVGWYRHHFDLPSSDQNRRIFLRIDGAMSHSMVWINGHFAGGWPYGYTSYELDLTPYLVFGGSNVLAVRLDNPDKSARWYPGSGIYRHVWLVKTSPVHVAYNGAYLTTPQISSSEAKVDLKVTLENSSSANAGIDVSTQIYELTPEGKRGALVAQSDPSTMTIPASIRQMGEYHLTVPSPKLWDTGTPNRYVAVTTLAQDGRAIDEYETRFGIRTIQFTADNGFILNGRRVQIQGVCDHSDLGSLGMAVNTRAMERKIETLKEMGCNAIRTSHNPPAPEYLELCDRMGIVVMDEAFDCWTAGKNANDYHLLFAKWHEKDLRSFIRRDRNHPCVVLWSIGNEVPEQGWGQKISQGLADIVHSEDPTRPVTAACDYVAAGFNGFQKTLDAFGYNYKYGSYEAFHQKNPTIPLFGSETASCTSSRGVYFFPLSHDHADFQVSSYDLSAPNWASPPDYELKAEAKYPFVFGQFLWTGFDYLGEPTPYNNDSTNLLNFTDPAQKVKMAEELKQLGKLSVPSRSSYFGAIDLAGFKKDLFYFMQAAWRPDFPMAHILPHWNWPERVGLKTPVFVYTSGDEAELFLNGQSLGRKAKGSEFRLRWDDVVYQPGELKVQAYKNGRPWASDVVRTTGVASNLMLAADRATLHADGQDLAFVTVSVKDKDGAVVPRSSNVLKFEISGPGKIVATDNGDATCLDSFQAAERPAFNGLALVVIRTLAGQEGNLTLTATSPGLASTTINLKTQLVIP